MKILLTIGLLLSSLIILLNCSRNTSQSLIQIPYQPTPVTLRESERVPKMLIPADNPLTAEGIALGRRLFFDPILSIDSTFSCASCHLPERAFSDGKRVAIGIRMRKGRRNSPSLVNVGYYYKGLFWDGRVITLEEQSLHPVVDSVEMGHTWANVETLLRKHSDYPILFRKAFGIQDKSQITKDLVSKALAQFQRTLISKNSKFDQVQRGEAQFTEAERRGFTIFFDTSMVMAQAECSHCHMDPLFTTLAYENNGVQIAKGLDYPDQGRGAITGNPYDNGKFKVPSLVNIALTAPYMHDGRFRTLEAVIEHYNKGGHPGENVSPNVRPLNLTEQDKADLIAFLHTLTDTTSLKISYLEH
ncbi:MAG: cytochrome-c peroxidase [Saprospiraceae bacterium]